MGGQDFLLFDGMLLSFAWPVLLLIQLACLVHVLKTGRPYWWIWIIFGFPLVGLLAYLYLEVRPSWGKNGIQSLLWKLKSSRERIQILEAALADSSTIKNRLILADELHQAGQYDRECEVLADGLRGPFKDDAQLLMRLAQAHLEAGRTAEADEVFAKVVPERSPDSQLQHGLLRARLLGQLGRHAEAETLFKELMARKKSEACRYYYAHFLFATGRREQALPILRDILQQYRRGTVVWRHLERRWYYASRRLLKTPAR